jgi:hypothetical protein
MALSSQPFADIGVADADGEQAEGDGKHQDIHHGVCSGLRLDMERSGSPDPGWTGRGTSTVSGLIAALAHNQWR